MNPIAEAYLLIEKAAELQQEYDALKQETTDLLHAQTKPQVLLSGLNREAWLHAMTEKLREMFSNAELPLPEEMHISVGFPSRGATGKKKRRIGEHWNGASSDDGKPHIFISPLLKTIKEVGETLVHELVHAALPTGTKHGPAFKAAMLKVGLTGKPTETEAGHELEAKLLEIAEQLGEYPHGGLNAHSLEGKKQTTRMVKVTCPEHPDFVIRASRKVIAMGLPACGMCVAGLAVPLTVMEPERDIEEILEEVEKDDEEE
jgi:hypothetical protein